MRWYHIFIWLIVIALMLSYQHRKSFFINETPVTVESNVDSSMVSPLQCNPILCNSRSATTHLTLISRGDGVGATIQQIIYAAAYAWKRHWNFGGITEPNYSHGVMKDVLMEYLFGNYESILRKTKLRDIRASRVQIKTMSALESFKTPADSTIIDFRDTKFDLDSLGSLNNYITPSFLQALRCSAYCHIASTMKNRSIFTRNPTSMKVVAHIRRGDVQLNDSSRITTDASYFRIFGYIHRLYPDAELHAFTSTTKMTQQYAQMIVSYASRNITLHVDSEDYADLKNDYDATYAVKIAWAHFITADIFITSKSSFSTVPALFNSNCVLYQRFWHRSLRHWIVLPIGPDGKESERLKDWNHVFAAQLPQCVSDARTAARDNTPSTCKVCPPV